MSKILLAYATKNGSTGEVAQFMGDVLSYHGLDAVVADVDTISEVKPYDVFIFGSPVYSGMWLPEMYRFIKYHTETIGQKPVYCWITCIRVLEENGYDHVINHYMPDSLLDQLNVRQITAFAGKLKWAEINWTERWTLALQYDGKADARNFNADHRDWNIIRQWSVKLAEDIRICQGLI